MCFVLQENGMVRFNFGADPNGGGYHPLTKSGMMGPGGFFVPAC